jgi:hypothetical protein
MAKLARRGFLKQTSAGVAAVGLLAAIPVAASPEVTDSAETGLSELSAAGLPETLVAHISDFSTGEISLLVGTQEIIYRDPELVARLLRAVP